MNILIALFTIFVVMYAMAELKRMNRHRRSDDMYEYREKRKEKIYGSRFRK